MERHGNSFSCDAFRGMRIEVVFDRTTVKTDDDFLSYDLYLELNRAFRHIRLRIVLAPLEIGI